MGSTLTNTQPKDTYKSLLKTSDSSELSATAKYVSDGNGNDSTLALSTNNVGIGTIAPDIFSRFYARTVGIDSSGITKIQLNGTTYSGIDMGQGGTRYAELNTSSLGLDVATIGALPIRFYPNGGNRVSITTDGLTFNGDTAAANALDDYEEGTFTPTFSGTTYGGATSNIGRYTKIGRLVHFDIFLYGASFSSSSGPAIIGGLPFTANTQVYGQGLITYNTAVDGNTNGGYIDAGSTNFYPVDENSTAVSSFIDGTVSLMVSGRYTV